MWQNGVYPIKIGWPAWARRICFLLFILSNKRKEKQHASIASFRWLLIVPTPNKANSRCFSNKIEQNWKIKQIRLNSFSSNQHTTWSEIGITFRAANMAQIAIHPPNYVSWVPENCRRNRGKGDFRENTESFHMLLHGTLIPNFPIFLSIGVVSKRFLASVYDWVCLGFSIRLSVYLSVRFDVFLSVCRLVSRLARFM